MFRGLEHTAIATPDPEKLARWYVETLEFTINHRYAGNVFVKAPNGTMLELIPSEGERAEQGMKAPGIRHLAIIPDDFEAARRALEAKGVHFVTDVLEMDGNRLLFFTDPDGNLLHLIHRDKPLP